jgi:hypothetical protein
MNVPESIGTLVSSESVRKFGKQPKLHLPHRGEGEMNRYVVDVSLY